MKKIDLPDWATCFSLSRKSPLIAVGSKGKLGAVVFFAVSVLLSSSYINEIRFQR